MVVGEREQRKRKRVRERDWQVEDRIAVLLGVLMYCGEKVVW